jgi:hypothetical protein
MGSPTWRQVVPELTVPTKTGDLWTLAREYVLPGRLLKIEADGQWQPEGLTLCGPDGDPSSAAVDLPLARAARGALLARIGGSTADHTADAQTMLLFAVGRVCVVRVPEDKQGALFLGINDRASSASKLAGNLKVRVFEGL